MSNVRREEQPSGKGKVEPMTIDKGKSHKEGKAKKKREEFVQIQTKAKNWTLITTMRLGVCETSGLLTH